MLRRAHLQALLRRANIIVTHPLAAGQAAFVVLAGEAFGGQIAEGPAAVAAVGVVVVVCQRVTGLIHKATTRLQVVLQQVEETVICQSAFVTPVPSPTLVFVQSISAEDVTTRATYTGRNRRHSAKPMFLLQHPGGPD